MLALLKPQKINKKKANKETWALLTFEIRRFVLNKPKQSERF